MRSLPAALLVSSRQRAKGGRSDDPEIHEFTGRSHGLLGKMGRQDRSALSAAAAAAMRAGGKGSLALMEDERKGPYVKDPKLRHEHTVATYSIT